jgi:hypothetical protein
MKKYIYLRVKVENDMGTVIGEDGKIRSVWGVELEDDDIPIGFEDNNYGHFINILRHVLPEPRPEPNNTLDTVPWPQPKEAIGIFGARLS